MTAPIASPWMSAEECAVYLRFVHADGSPDLKRLYYAKARLGLPASRISRRALRFHRLFVDEWVERGPGVAMTTRRRARVGRPAPLEATSGPLVSSPIVRSAIERGRAQLQRLR